MRRGVEHGAGARRQRAPLWRAKIKGSKGNVRDFSRDLVLGSTGAALVFGLKGPVLFIGAAQAQRAADSLKYKVGDIEVFSLHEGSVERTVTEAMVKNASLDDVKKALTAAGIGPDKIDNPFTVTAIRTGGKVVLFDTGFGGNGPATVGKLADNTKAAGLDPAAVSIVVISHFHPDHILGLWVKETDAQVFPNAEILMPEVEYKFWTDPALVEKLPEADRPIVKRIQATFPTWKNVKQYNDGADVAPGVRRSRPRATLSATCRSSSPRADSNCSSRATSPASISCSSKIPAGSRASMPTGRKRKPRGARSSIA